MLTKYVCSLQLPTVAGLVNFSFFQLISQLAELYSLAVYFDPDATSLADLPYKSLIVSDFYFCVLST